MEKQEHIEVKVYLDTNLIFDPIKIDNIEQGEVEALKTLSESQRVKFYVSEKVKKEIEKHKNPKKKNYLLFLYNLIQKVPEENIIKDVPFLFDAIMFDEGVFDGNIKKEDPLFIKLKQIFDKEDAELIFQAEKNDLDYFSTLDKKTILNRLREKENQLKEINLKIKIVSPSQLIKELGLDTKSL
jgi:predicted nucleic acid-binding protein